MATTAPSDFASAYGRFVPPVRAKCHRILGRSAVAEEITQETFTRLWQSGLPLDGTASARTIMSWLYVTSTRLAVDVLREGRVTSFDAVTLDSIPCGTSPVGMTAARSALVALGKIIPADEMEVVLLLRVDGLTQAEAAGLLGISERTVRRLLERFDQRSAALRKEVVE
jgi:RNA polymerase sigma-70 factor (ECF subfamily)